MRDVSEGQGADAALVIRAQMGDADAYADLVRRYRRPAYFVALSVTGRHEDAEDAAQEAFLVALRRIEECRDPRRFGGWFLTIVRNRSLNLVRRETLRATEEVPRDATSASRAPDQIAADRELAERLTAALGALPETQRDVVVLHDVEGWKHREIAERLGMPPGTVRSHLHFARKALRVALGPVWTREEAG